VTVATVPDALGRFGQFGGKYVPETLMPALAELEQMYYQCKNDPSFQSELQFLGSSASILIILISTTRPRGL